MKQKNVFIIIFIAFFVIFLTGCGMTLRVGVETFSSNKRVLSDTASDEELASLTKCEIQLDKDYISQNNIDKIKITAIMTDDNAHPVQFSEKTYSEYDVNSNGKVMFDFKFFGKHEVTIMYFSEGKNRHTELVDVILTSDEYNIGLLLSTLPPTYFTLLMT